jgi:hypothetical protein
MRRSCHVTVLAGALTLITLTLPPSAATAQTGKDTYVATASVKGTAAGSAIAPVVIVIERYTTDAERAKAVDALKSGATPALTKLLSTMPAIGHIEVVAHRTPIKYAYARSVGSGRLITVITDQPIAYLGENVQNPKPKAGYDLAFALLTVPAAGKGTGELAPAAKAKVNNDGAVVTEDYGAEVVVLGDVEKKP